MKIPSPAAAPRPAPGPNRRTLLKAAAAGSWLILPGGTLYGQSRKPSARLNIAFIGMGGQIQGHVSRVIELGHTVAALCDVDARQIEASRKQHGEPLARAAAYRDYRVLLEKETALDAVVIATPDHWHAPICRAAMQAGRHVYCEKPLTHTIAEARQLREMARASKVITQTGNQGSASPALRRSLELIKADLFGPIREIHVWHPEHGWPHGTARPSDTDPVPDGLDWDFWLGPAPARAYKNGLYHPGQWRGWYDFGNGSLGDFCCHGFNMPVRALGLEYPTRIDITGTGLGQESFATACTVRYQFPARGNRGPVTLNFYTGGDAPPEDVTARLRESVGRLPATGCLLIGEKGQLQSGLWNSDCSLRLDDDAKFLGAGNHPAAMSVPESLPRVSGHLDEWLDACLGGPAVFSDFDRGGHLTEIGLAGIVALRLQRSIDWDGPAMKVPGVPEADRLIRKEERPGFV